MKNWDALKQRLKQAKNISIISHPSPDGDSIGSSLGLYWFLKEHGHQSKVLTPDPPPVYLDFLEGFEEIIYPEKNRDEVKEALLKADLIFCLDFNQLDRLRDLEEYITNNEIAFIINIDHHQNPDNFPDFQYCFPEASSTGELIYKFICDLGEEEHINSTIAAALYTGILTDTGSFRFPSTSAQTHFAVAKLLETGLEHTFIHQKVFDSFSKNRLELIGFALNNRLLFLNEFSTAIIHLSEKDLKQFNYMKGDTEGLVNYPLLVADINFSILITETDSKVKLSFRSKGNFPVNEFSKKYFNGGGHINAAGGISDLTIQSTIEKITSLLPNYRNELSY